MKLVKRLRKSERGRRGELLAQISFRRAHVWAHAADGTPYDNRDIHEIGEEAARKACV